MMNNDNYGFPNLDSNFTLDMPKANNDDLQPFQGNIGIDVNFPQHDFSANGDNYFGQQQQQNNLTDYPVQGVAYPTNVEPSLNSTALNNHPYYSEFSDQTVSSQPFSQDLLSSQGHFINSVSQPQDYPNQLEPAEFLNQSNVYSDVPDVCSNLPQSAVKSVDTLSSTSTYLDDSSKTYYSGADSNNPEASALFYPPCDNEVSLADSFLGESILQRDQYSKVNTAAFAPLNGDSLCSAGATRSKEAVLLTNCNEAPTESSTVNASCDSSKTEVSPVTLEPISNEHFCLGPPTNEVNSENAVDQNCKNAAQPIISIENNSPTPASENSDSIPSEIATQAPIEENSHIPETEESDRLCQAESVTQLETPIEETDLEPGKEESDELCQAETNIQPIASIEENDPTPAAEKSEESSQAEIATLPEENGPKLGTETSGELCQAETDTQPIISVEETDGKSDTDVQTIVSVGKEIEEEPQREQESNSDLSKEPMNETLDDLSNSLEKGIEASLEENFADLPDTNAPELTRPLSPMITALDGSFDDIEPVVKTESSPDDATKQTKKGGSETNVRVTRLRTGALQSKPLVDVPDPADDSSDESVSYEDWYYEDGAEVAPSVVANPSISVSEKVLQVTAEEIEHYVRTFSTGVEGVLQSRLHCTACGKHIGACPNRIHIGNRHKILRVLICNKCQGFYGTGKFRKDKDGSELYCRWCGQGGQVICCSNCPCVFCQPCILRNFGNVHLSTITESNDWACFVCNYKQLWDLRAICWGLLTHTMKKKREALIGNDAKMLRELEYDMSTCCSKQNKRRKLPRSVARFRSGVISSQKSTAPPRVPFGHFVFEDNNFSVTATPVVTMAESAGEEEEFIDPSQFVQSVLEEPRPSQTRLLSKPSMARIAPKPVPSLQPVRMLGPQGSCLLNTNVPVMGQASASPRLIIRQGNLMQPGLVPINNQPNSIVPITRPRPPLAARNSAGKRPQGPPGSFHPVLSSRNPPISLSNIDGVRSLEQLQSLDQVTWFRDGLDSIRAVGFALNKRMRELEARFHSLKNKQDVDKVMFLGKKLERLSHKSERRFTQISSALKTASRSWLTKNTNCSGTRPTPPNPFSTYSDADSDWDDEIELLKPLEKVMIPVSSAALHSATLRSSVQTVYPSPPPLSLPNVTISPTTSQRGGIVPQVPQLSMRKIVGPPSSKPLPTRFLLPKPPPLRPFPPLRPNPLARRVGPQPPPVQTVSSNANPVQLSRVRLPGPKSSMNRYIHVENVTNITGSVLKRSIQESVRGLINEKNAINSVSISLTSFQKRKRLDSDSSNCSDVILCPTIPELLRMHNVKPCKVHLKRCDDFIVSFLNKQQLARSKTVTAVQDISDNECDSVLMPEILFHDVNSFPEAETTYLPSDGLVSTISLADNNRDGTNNCASTEDDGDDDIEIIHEVNNPDALG